MVKQHYCLYLISYSANDASPTVVNHGMQQLWSILLFPCPVDPEDKDPAPPPTHAERLQRLEVTMLDGEMHHMFC